MPRPTTTTTPTSAPPADLISEQEFAQISEMVYRHCRINLHDGKRELVRARLAKQMRTAGFATAQDYLQHVREDPSGQAFTQFIDSLSTNLTSFFREDAHFRYLVDRFLPNLVARRTKEGTRRVLAWSAGCSSGEEPYSLAMTLLDALPGADPWDVRLLATDISTRVLGIARRGWYGQRQVQSIPPQVRQRYMTATRDAKGTAWCVVPELKQVVHFRHLNLMEPWPFKGPFDFIFCRNVMIYFDKPTQQALVNRYFDVLQPGGLLFTGHSESLTGVAHRFQYVQPTIYAKPASA